MTVRWACKPTANRLLTQVGEDLEVLKAKGVNPHLAVILVGHDSASEVYVNNKIKTCEKTGILSTYFHFPEPTPDSRLLEFIAKLNANPDIHGILVQLPLPAHIDEHKIIAALDPNKDVDGFHPVNIGRLSLGSPGLFPCTPMGVMELFRDNAVDLQGKHAVVIGCSNIVGKPMAQMLLNAHCTTTLVHRFSQNKEAIARHADILVTAVGHPGLVDASWLKPDVLIVDVGINQVTDETVLSRLVSADSKKMKTFRREGRVLYGDILYDSARHVAAKITPVPGGVGLLTIAHLMVNCLTAAKRSASFEKD